MPQRSSSAEAGFNIMSYPLEPLVMNFGSLGVNFDLYLRMNFDP
jgi:hypothetical protein